MAFQFRLRPILKHRAFKLQEAQAAFGVAESHRLEIVAKADRVREKLRVERVLFEKERQAGIETPRYLNFTNHLDYLERELLQIHIELEKAAEESEFRKQVMIDCDKAVRVLESVEQREWEMYQLLKARKDQKRLDEIAVFKDCRERACGRGNYESE